MNRLFGDQDGEALRPGLTFVSTARTRSGIRVPRWQLNRRGSPGLRKVRITDDQDDLTVAGSVTTRTRYTTGGIY